MRRPGASAPGRRSPPVSRRAPSSGWRRPSVASPPTTCPFPASRGRRAMFPTPRACSPPRARRSRTDRHPEGARHGRGQSRGEAVPLHRALVAQDRGRGQRHAGEARQVRRRVHLAPPRSRGRALLRGGRKAPHAVPRRRSRGRARRIHRGAPRRGALPAVSHRRGPRAPPRAQDHAQHRQRGERAHGGDARPALDALLMSRTFVLPDLGEGLVEAEIRALLVKEGDLVKEDAPLLEVETDKAQVEIPSPFAGRVEKIHVQPGQTVKVGQPLVSFGDTTGATAPPPAAPRRSAPAAPVTEPKAPTAPATASTHTAPAPAKVNGGPIAATPSTRRLARELGVDLHDVRGTGPGGRITDDDVRGAGKPAAATAAPTAPRAPAPSGP